MRNDITIFYSARLNLLYLFYLLYTLTDGKVEKKAELTLSMRQIHLKQQQVIKTHYLNDVAEFISYHSVIILIFLVLVMI